MIAKLRLFNGFEVTLQFKACCRREEVINQYKKVLNKRTQVLNLSIFPSDSDFRDLSNVYFGQLLYHLIFKSIFKDFHLIMTKFISYNK